VVRVIDSNALQSGPRATSGGLSGIRLIPRSFSQTGQANTWGTWTEGFDWWTVDNWRGFITQLTKMKMNFIGMHSYPLEPTVWVGSPTELDPTGERVVDPYPASYTTTLKHAFSYQPKNTSEYTGGGALAFPTECCCGVSAAATDRCPIPLNACAAAAVFNDQAGVMASAFSWAARYGVATALGTETPVVQAHEQLNGTGGLTNASAASAEVLYRGIFAHLNATLGHNLTYYWFWTPEGYSWSKYPHNSSQWDLAIGDMLAGHAVWGEAAWPFELATAGWTLGPKDDPAYLDRVLPTDGFKALSGLTYKVGRDPDEFGSSTSTGYANVTRRPAWIMPWMESDDALGWPELWVNRTLDIANRAAGTKGLVGLQWRTEEVMPQFSALAQRGWDAALTSDVFWADFAVANFGLEVAPEIATILASVDGDRDSVDARAMPFFTSCCPGAIKSPNKQPWSELSTQFTFVDDLVALRPKVNGTANVGRFDSWLHNFEYLRQGGQISCLFNNYTLANAHAMAIADPQQRLTALRQTVVPLRQAMVDVWEKLTAHQLQAVGTRGAMGTIQNMEAISKHALLDAPGEALTAALGAGAILPQPTMAYTGSDRVFLPNLRTVIADAESLLIEAVVLSKSPPTTVALYYRTVSSDAGHQSMLSAWTPTPLTQTTAGRGVWTVRSEPATHPEHRDVESRGGVDGWLQIVECSSPAAGPWVFMPSGALSLNGSACLGPGGGSLPVNSSTGCLGEMALSACTATSPAWEVTSAPGFPTIALKGVVGSWGPAAVAGNVVVGTAVFLCTLTGSNEQYCAAHHSCDYRYDPAAKRLIHEQSQLCLGTGPKQGPTPPTPPFGPCTVPPTPPPPPPGTWRLNGSITEYFVAATFDDGAVVTYPPGSFVGNIRDGDTVTVVVESR
jgi:hypothetical protein